MPLKPFFFFVFAATASCTAVGPTTRAIEQASTTAAAGGLRVIPVTDQVAQQVNIAEVRGDFAQRLGDATPIGTQVGVGDTLEVTIWEAAPAALFGTEMLDSGIGSGVATSRPNTLPEILVGPSGAITVPLPGRCLLPGIAFVKSSRKSFVVCRAELTCLRPWYASLTTQRPMSPSSVT